MKKCNFCEYTWESEEAYCPACGSDDIEELAEGEIIYAYYAGDTDDWTASRYPWYRKE